MTAPLRLVFTDLDGSLLDHDNYSARAALPLLRELARRGIPVIPASSKTRVEIEQVCTELDLGGPFIVENGAAVCIPAGYFDPMPARMVARGGYHQMAFVAPRSQWLGLLEALAAEFEGEFESFARAGLEGVAAMTGLASARAALALRREYSEPVRWLGTSQRCREFVRRLQAAGATVQQGGRFLSVSGPCDKGRALGWLRQLYRERHPGRELDDLAVGDSANDAPMLQAAKTALWVRSPVHDFPRLQRDSGILYSDAVGPAGWAEGVGRWLRESAPRGA